MKRRLPPWLVSLAALVLLSVSGLQGSEVRWQGTGSGAWITGSNWVGGAMPGAGDVAEFGEMGVSAVSLALHHPSYTPKGEAWVAAISLLAERVTRDLTVAGNANSASKLYFEGATLHGVADTILVNESGRLLTLAPRTGSVTRDMSLELRPEENHVIQVRGAGDIAIGNAINGAQSQLTVQVSGTGKVTLEGAGSSYSGGTVLQGGTLFIAASQAAGTGRVTVQSGVLEVAPSVVFDNAVSLASPAALYRRSVESGGGFSTLRAQGGEGASTVEARLLAGMASAPRTLSLGFEATSSAVNDAVRRSEVLHLDEMEGDVYVLELQLTEAAVSQGYFLAWLGGEDLWVNAVEGNSATGTAAIAGFQGSFALSGAQATGDYLGSWGVDAGNGSVWAVLDHQSAFAVAVPEPGGLLLLGLGIAVLGFWRKR